MKRNVKDIALITQWLIQVVRYGWVGGGGVIQTLRLRGEGGLKKNFQPFGLQFRLKGWGFKGPPGLSSGSTTVTPLEGWFEMAIIH